MRGPYASEGAAAADCADVLNLPPGATRRDVNRARLLAACEKAGVELGDYDQRILRWLAGFEPQVGQVLVGIIWRAHQAGRGNR